jgi:hypothetical protein
LVASIIVAVVSTWLAAEANRREALRQDRRIAYAELIARAGSCESLAVFGFVSKPLPRVPSLSELGGFSRDELEELFDRLAGEVTENQRRLSLLKECVVPLRTSMATVILLSENAPIIELGSELVRDAIEVAIASERQLGNREREYVDSLTEFQILARESANAPVVSPLYIQIGGLLLIQLILLFALFMSWRRFRTMLRQVPEARGTPETKKGA